MNWPVIWVVVAIIMAVIEAVTVGLTTIWFAAGALISMVFAMLGFSYYVQISIFLASSFILLVLTRPIVKKFLKVKQVKTNVDDLIGKSCVVLKDIKEHRYGQVKLASQIWTAKSQTNQTILSGEEVTVISVEGVKLVVAKKGGTNG